MIGIDREKKRRFRRKGKKDKKPPKKPNIKYLYFVPYRVYAGGDFYDMYDDLQVAKAMEKDRALLALARSLKRSR